MGLQWVILSYVVAAEAAVALFLTLPSPSIIKSRIVSLVSLILQPALGIVPFAGFQLMDIYWKQEHRLMCTSETCTAAERDRYEKSIYKAQRNAILCLAACLLYWFVHRICNYYKELQRLEEVEKRRKNL
ncbi:uncharacterized protein LOC18421719 [Amborella trichopoda]|uniref:Endoplasmic reticulum transmembrane protein n=1 Tax=Amborella trichopoda TaxID=13333 RepID=W1NF89_AMBTC|nr:uncharacterized protein LOC18421719 [Amborella trichopoda]ERM93825.1 hypothetical protein AMTR_s00138p00051570 [Amborella trichopoda]|eukprot:XP_006826588.1 uncharacterized protein LOC18421719 [Amborella trichopoda]